MFLPRELKMKRIKIKNKTWPHGKATICCAASRVGWVKIKSDGVQGLLQQWHIREGTGEWTRGWKIFVTHISCLLVSHVSSYFQLLDTRHCSDDRDLGLFLSESFWLGGLASGKLWWGVIQWQRFPSWPKHVYKIPSRNYIIWLTVTYGTICSAFRYPCLHIINTGLGLMSTSRN